MMAQVLPDIPRFYTALAEWLACMIYILPFKKRFSGFRLGVALAAMLLIQCAIQLGAGHLALAFWVPGMAVAIAAMYGGILLCCRISWPDAGYCCARAFISAEFAASLGWLFYCFVFLQTAAGRTWIPFLVMTVSYLAVFGLLFLLEHRRLSKTARLNVSRRELLNAGLIAVSVFAISNVCFVVESDVFMGETGAALFLIRTVVDFSGLTMLYAQLEQRSELALRREVEALDHVINRQYEQYCQSKENWELLNRRCHDLKHQIAAIRMETDPDRREACFAEMEQLVKLAGTKYDTGNKILDTVLTTKNMKCIENQITLTGVIDGGLLDFMGAMDICSVFGNALDNAIESVMKLADPDKRLIRLAVYSQNSLLMIRFENYVEEMPKFVDGVPKTTKEDREYHGYGIKSIRQTAEKYGGNATIHVEHNWFILRILFPL